MKLVKPNAEFIPQEAGLEGIYKQIERCGRVCYKSEDKITDSSAKGFVDRMIKSNHTAMLEHGTVYLKREIDHSDVRFVELEENYSRNPYSKLAIEGGFIFITTNYRVLVENEWLDDLQFLCEPTKYHAHRYTVKFTTDIGVCREILRHRKFSFANESTRYCNYSKSKFGGELTFITPIWYTGGNGINDKECSMDSEFELSCEEAEKSYLRMISWGATPQEARQVLPLATKTELIATAFKSDWYYFFTLRLRGTTGRPHPDMKRVASLAFNQFVDNGIIDLVPTE